MIEATVMIASWNAARTIDRSVASALAQTDVSVDVVVVDDASSDGTADRVRDRPQVHVLQMSVNGGPAAARNRAIEASRGEWLAVLDADDTMAPGRLRRLIDLGRSMEADVVLGNFRRVSEDGEALGTEPFLAGPQYAHPCSWSLEDYVGGNQVRRGARSLGYLKPLFRRDFLARHGLRYDAGLRNGEDCHLVFSCLAFGGRVVYSPRPDYLYTVRKGSISHLADPAHLEALIDADAAFVGRHAPILSSKARGLFATRQAALKRMKLREEIMRDLKAQRLVSAAGRMLHHPTMIYHVTTQLLESAKKRAGH